MNSGGQRPGIASLGNGKDTPQPGALPRILTSGPTSAPERSALATSYSRCLESYQRLLDLIGKKSCRIVRLEQVNVGRILEEYGRLRIWGEQTRAALPEKTRGSLDDAMRNDESLRSNINSILTQLSRHLSRAIPIAAKSYDDSAQDSESSMTADSGSDSDSQADSYSNDDRSHRVSNRRHARVSKISVLVNLTFEQIQLLYRLSLLLNRPGLSGRYLRSTNKHEDDSKLSYFAEFDYKHICEKLHQWKRGLEVTIDEEGKEETATTAEDIEERKNREPSLSDETEILCRRLAKSNTRRREQLQYWIDHPDRPDVVRSRNATDAPEIDLTSGEARVKTKSVATKSQTSTVKLAEQKTVVDGQFPKSITSKQSFSTVAVSDVFNNKTSLAPRTIYAQSTVGNKTSNRVPDVPTAAKTSPTFKCPYCNLVLESKVMADRLSWKRHVFRDLRPYVCTFPGCLSPQKQYLTRHDWIYHEQQMHRRQWVCSEDCQQKFPTKDFMIEHLRSAHSSSLAQHQLPIMIEMSERPIDEDEILPCPLCPSEMYLSRLQTHLAEHLETISLFVLPNEVEENEDTDSDKVAWTGSKPDQNETGTQATLSSLGFSRTDEKGQTKEDFSKLLSMEETQGKVKCETWGADEAISAAVQKSNTSDTSIFAEGLVGPGLALPQQELPQAQSLPAHLRLGKEHLDSLTSMADQVSLYQSQGRLKEAEELGVQVTETSLRVLGAEDPGTLTSMADLATTYWNQWRWDEAEKLQVQVMETRLKLLGAEHPDTLTSMASLASTYNCQGRWDEAEKLRVQVMETRSKVLGAEHPGTLTSMADLALTYNYQGRLDEAEKLQVQLMETRLKVLGAEDPDTLTSMADLALTYNYQGRLDEAAKLQVQVMETNLKVLGAEHPDTLTSMTNLASTYNYQRRWNEAEKLQVQVMETRLKVLGAEDPDTLTSMAGLASTYERQGRLEEAEKLELQVMEIKKRMLGAEHSDTLTSMSNVARVLERQGKYHEAEKMYRQTLMLQEKMLGSDHHDTLTSMGNLSTVLSKQGKDDEAESLLRSYVSFR